LIPGTNNIQGGPPSFAGAASFLTFGFLNVRNVTGYGVIPPGQAATYYTRAVFENITGPDGGNYRLTFFPDDFTCPGVCVLGIGYPGNNPTLNQPVETAWVKVTYSPANGSSPDQWVVEGNLTTSTDPEIQRGTLFLNGSKTLTHYGQYSMPFKLVITAQTTLPQ